MFEPTTPSRMVGILGGMGPAATVDFYDKIIKATAATRDQDHLRVVIWADPTVPDRTSAFRGLGEDPTPWLERGVQQLMDCGAEILAVPCNTIHAYLPAVVRDKDVEFISIIDAAVEAAQQATDTTKIGVLATGAALSSGLYHRALASEGLEEILPSPDAQAALMKIIYRIKAGDTGDQVCNQIRAILEELHRRSVTTVIAACTEISMIITQLETGLNIIDPSQALALKTVERAQADLPTRPLAQLGSPTNGDRNR